MRSRNRLRASVLLALMHLLVGDAAASQEARVVAWVERYFEEAANSRSLRPQAGELATHPWLLIEEADKRLKSTNTKVVRAAILLYDLVGRRSDNLLLRQACVSRLLGAASAWASEGFDGDARRKSLVSDCVGLASQYRTEDFVELARAQIVRIASRWPTRYTIRLVGVGGAQDALPWLATLVDDSRLGWASRMTRARLGVDSEVDYVVAVLVEKAHRKPQSRGDVARELDFIQNEKARDALIDLALTIDEVQNANTDAHPNIYHAGFFLGHLVGYMPEMPNPYSEDDIAKQFFAYNGDAVRNARDWVRKWRDGDGAREPRK